MLVLLSRVYSGLLANLHSLVQRLSIPRVVTGDFLTPCLTRTECDRVILDSCVWVKSK